MSDTGLAIGVETNRKSGSIAELARDVCAVGISAGEIFGDASAITDHPDYRPVPTASRTPAVTVRAIYSGDPILSPDAPTLLALEFENHTGAQVKAGISVLAPEGILFTPNEITLELKPGEQYRLHCRAELSPDTKIL